MLRPKTMGELREWANDRDEQGYFMSDDWVVMVTDSGVQAHHPACGLVAAMFSTEPEEIDNADADAE